MEIKNRKTGEIIFSGEYSSMRECVEDAVRKKISLQWAYLQGVDLQDADLQDADLQWASLRWSGLQGSILQRSRLQGADLQGARLQRVDLQDADLQDAGLYVANFHGVAGAIQWQAPAGIKRICYSVAHGEKVMQKIGCLWGDTEEVASAIIKKYCDNSLYEKIMRLNAEALQ